MQDFFDFVKSLGSARLPAMGAVTLALIGFFAFLMVRMTTPQMVPLFTDLSMDDSAAILKDLDRQGVSYQIKDGGAVIMVPREKVARLRMQEAENGLPKGGGVGYEIFDKSDTLGATSFVQNINKLRALEGELSRTITSLDSVDAVRVHLVLPDRQLFSREKSQASASIVLKVRGTLEPSQVRTIRHLVASAVRGLKPERISVIETGKLLADGAGDPNSLSGANADERKIAYENRLRKQVENIVTSVVGPGHARVQINADFDVNRITQTSDKYDPDSRVVRSSQTRKEKSYNGNGNGGEVSVGNELPAGAKNSGAANSSSGGSHDSKSEEIVNHEISHTTKTEVIDAGQVNRISAAVLVDGTYVKNKQGQMVYKPRSKQEIDRIAALGEENRESAERIKALLDAASTQTLMRNIDKHKLAIALKGSSETVRQFFFSNMSMRATKMLVDDMQALDPVRLRDVDEAQALLVNIAKDLAAKGEILISKGRGDEEMIY